MLSLAQCIGSALLRPAMPVFSRVTLTLTRPTATASPISTIYRDANVDLVRRSVGAGGSGSRVADEGHDDPKSQRQRNSVRNKKNNRCQEHGYV